MVMIILGNYKNNYDIATKTAQWALTPKQLNLVLDLFWVNILLKLTRKAQLGKGSKIKLIIFAEFSANGGGVPPIRENN